MNSVIISLIVNFICGLIFVINLRGEVTFYAMSVMMSGTWLLSLLGSVRYFKTRKKGAYVLAFVCFVFFIPIGIIGLLGLKNMRREDLSNRTSEAEKAEIGLQEN